MYLGMMASFTIHSDVDPEFHGVKSVTFGALYCIAYRSTDIATVTSMSTLPLIKATPPAFEPDSNDADSPSLLALTRMELAAVDAALSSAQVDHARRMDAVAAAQAALRIKSDAVATSHHTHQKAISNLAVRTTAAQRREAEEARATAARSAACDDSRRHCSALDKVGMREGESGGLRVYTGWQTRERNTSMGRNTRWGSPPILP